MTTSKASSRTTDSGTEVITEEGFIGVGTTSLPISLEGSGTPDTMTTATRTRLPIAHTQTAETVSATARPETTARLSPEELGSGAITQTAPAHPIVTDEVATTVFTEVMTTSEALSHTTDSEAKIITEDGFIGVVTTKSSPSVEGWNTRHCDKWYENNCTNKSTNNSTNEGQRSV